jgi:hypothetical protein
MTEGEKLYWLTTLAFNGGMVFQKLWETNNLPRTLVFALIVFGLTGLTFAGWWVITHYALTRSR